MPSKKRGYNLLDEVLLTEFQIADIRILTDQRRLDIKWNKVILIIITLGYEYLKNEMYGVMNYLVLVLFRLRI